MDYLSTVYDSTQHDNFYPPACTGQALTTSELTTFINQLLTTLELEELGRIYFQQIRSLLPTVSISLADLDPRWVFGHAKISATLVEMPLNNGQPSTSDPKNVYYYFSKPLSLSQINILNQLHELFVKQVNHGLSLRRMHELATKDILTNLGNRSGFDQALSRQLAWAQRHKEAFSLLILDLDNFKRVNDTFGHREGDKVLTDVANQLTQSLRNEDQAFRFGGDEFCCILDCQTQQQLECAASRIQLSINQSPYLSSLNISCSLGGTISQKGDDIANIFDRADAALYKVKHSGKNSYQAA